MRFLLAACAGLLAAGAASAQEAVPEGYPEQLIYQLDPGIDPTSDRLEQNVGASRIWTAGQTLRVCFFGGGTVVRELIAKVGAEWEAYANLKLDFGPAGNRYSCMVRNPNDPKSGFSEIRVGFTDRGYWSSVGQDSIIRVTQYQPSMNLVGFNAIFGPGTAYAVDNVVASAPEEYKGVIRHEFGHAIGLLHEHQNRNLDCWNHLIKSGPNNVYDYYYKTYRWDPPQVERNLGLAVKTDPDAVSGAIDKESIMSYVLVAEILIGGAQDTCHMPQRKNFISALDQAFVRTYYPKTNRPVVVNDTEISGVSLAVANAPRDPAFFEDFKDRIFFDLDSNDPIVRRYARARLSDQLVASGDTDQVRAFTDALDKGSYRTQLGVAVALADAGMAINLSDKSSSDLSRVLAGATDPTLKSFLQKIPGVP